MQIGVAGLVFALVQILFSAECKILSICTSEKQVFTCTSGTTNIVLCTLPRVTCKLLSNCTSAKRVFHCTRLITRDFRQPSLK